MATLPADLKVLCRKITSIPPAQLPHSLPSLVRHVCNCRDVLSAPQDEKKLKADASQTSVHVHRLKTSITTLLNGRSREGRFAAVGLLKAAVDVGGWETLRGAEPWVRGLLSIVQKADPAASKELAIVTLTKIFLLVHSYQTLVREIATPFIPAFVTACLQLLKPKTPVQPVPSTLAQTICESFSKLIPLYSPTFRPFSSQIRAAVRGFLAPTCSDGLVVPAEDLQRAARRLVISLHYVAAKSNGSDEWSKLLDDLLKEFHATADQVLRAVDESWGATSGRSKPSVGVDGEPHGGDTSVDTLPPWSGLDAGVQRLIGIFSHLADILSSRTKAAVTIPISELMETVSRVCLIAKLSKSQTWEQSVETNAAIGREEKEELWSLMPDLHVAALRLVVALIKNLERHMIPLVPELLDHLVRVFKSGIALPSVRATGYAVLNDILNLAGPTLSKASVDTLDPLIGACCRDLQQHSGFLEAPVKPAAATGKDSKKNGSAAVNTDLFLQPQAAAATSAPTPLESDHAAAAASLLPVFLSCLPQSHLKPILRGLVDKTAILTRSREAMTSSVLNPYRDQRGRMYPSILPHLSRQFPNDQALEILRSNLRTSGVPGGSGAMSASIGEIADETADAHEEAEEPDQDVDLPDRDEPPITDPSSSNLTMAPQARIELPVQTSHNNPFEPSASSLRESSPPKRKHEGADDRAQPKRQELEKSPQIAQPARVADLPPAAVDGDDSDDESEGSVHLNMVLEDDEEDEEEEDA